MSVRKVVMAAIKSATTRLGPTTALVITMATTLMRTNTLVKVT